MLTLYYKPTCSFSRYVISTADRLGLELELKDILSDEAIAAELEEHGGKRQVPYLTDSETGVGLYESEVIVKYLQSTYGQPVATATRPRVHLGGSTCVSCEG